MKKRAAAPSSIPLGIPGEQTDFDLPPQGLPANSVPADSMPINGVSTEDVSTGGNATDAETAGGRERARRSAAKRPAPTYWPSQNVRPKNTRPHPGYSASLYTENELDSSVSRSRGIDRSIGRDIENAGRNTALQIEKLKGKAVQGDMGIDVDPGDVSADRVNTDGISTDGIGTDGQGVKTDTLRQASERVFEEALGQDETGEEDPAGEGGRHNAAFDPAAVWKMVLSELAMQMPPSTYDTWVRDTVVLGYEDGEFIIGLPNAYARDWAENRLRHSIKRTLSSILQRSVQVRFRIRPKEQPTPDRHEELGDAPLYRQLASTAETVENNRENATANGMGQNGSKTAGQTPRGAQSKAQEAAHEAVHKTVHEAGRETVRRPSAFRGQENGAMHSLHEQPREVPNLNPHHTFDTFVVGNHNRLAHAAALAIVDAPGQTFNPLFIYGGVGLGKTHLLHSIGNSMGARGLKLLYCSSEQFTNDLISAIRTQTTEEFRNKYRQVDILLIDDIQFIAGKETTQEEFFHTFNHLHAAGRQVVLSSDRPPKALPRLEERLRSRFEGGLQTDIAQPDFETRVAILQSKGNRMGIPVPYEVLLLVAERVDSNIRELEGALNRLFMQARLADCAITVGFAQTILEDLSPQRSPCAPGELVRIVAEHFGLRADDLTGRKRTKEIANARQIAMYLLREEHDLSLPAIGGHLGGRDHSTVRYGVSSVGDDLKNDESLRMTIMTLREKIYAPSA